MHFLVHTSITKGLQVARGPYCLLHAWYMIFTSSDNVFLYAWPSQLRGVAKWAFSELRNQLRLECPFSRIHKVQERIPLPLILKQASWSRNNAKANSCLSARDLNWTVAWSCVNALMACYRQRNLHGCTHRLLRPRRSHTLSQHTCNHTPRCSGATAATVETQQPSLWTTSRATRG